MKKIAVLSLFIMTFAVFTPECYAITEGGCIPDFHVDEGGIVIGVIWGTAKGCWSAYWASEGSKWDSFVESFKEEYEECTSRAAEKNKSWWKVWK